MKVFTRGTNIQAETDSCVRFKYSHHEIVVVDDEVAFVGGIDLTLDGATPSTRRSTPSGVRSAGTTPRSGSRARRSRTSRTTSAALARPGEERLPEPAPQASKGDVELQVVRTIPGRLRGMPEGEFSVFESYSRALQSAERLVYLENQFLWSPEIVSILVDKLRDPPPTSSASSPSSPRGRTTARTSRGAPSRR